MSALGGVGVDLAERAARRAMRGEATAVADQSERRGSERAADVVQRDVSAAAKRRARLVDPVRRSLSITVPTPRSRMSESLRSSRAVATTWAPRAAVTCREMIPSPPLEPMMSTRSPELTSAFSSSRCRHADTGGLRERKKRETRSLIAQTGARLFAERREGRRRMQRRQGGEASSTPRKGGAG